MSTKKVNSRLSHLRLDANENLNGPSPKVIDRLRKISSKEMAAYPEYDCLYEKLSNRLQIESNKLLISAGADEALQLLFQVLLEAGDEVIFIDPCFSQYMKLCEQKGIVPKMVRCNKEFPSEKLLDAISPNTRLVMIATPNNPTGTVAPETILQKISQRLTTGYLVIDEAYVEFSGENNLTWASSTTNTCILRTFSKAYGLAGFRIGYMSGPEELVGKLKAIQQPYSVSRLAVEAAIAASDDEQYIDEYIAEVTTGRLKLIDCLQEMKIDVWPSAANFLWCDFGEKAKSVFNQLNDAGILVRYFAEYPTFLRITVGNAKAVDQLIDTLQRILLDPKVIIFDMDGVLVDESCSYRECIRETVFDFSGQRPSIDEVNVIKAKGGVNDDFDCVSAILREKGKDIPQQSIIDTFNQRYWGNDGDGLFLKEQWIMPASILRQLRRRYRLAIVTGRPKRDAEMALNRFGMANLFDQVITADDVKIGKPDPEGINIVLDAMKTRQAVYVGDLIDDRKAAENAGIPFIAKKPPGQPLEQYAKTMPDAVIIDDPQELIKQLMPCKRKRESSVCRMTTETAIELSLNLDGSGESKVNTGIGFLDHMLTSFSKHGLFDLELICRGDLEIDQHHTVEDVGICLGEAIRSSVGEKRGIYRSGFFVFPMDEARGTCAVDLSGRSVLQYQLSLNDGKIGDFDLVNLRNFFEGFVQGAKCNLQLDIPTGDDPHHKVEALFKAFGKAIRMACAIDERMGNRIPSTKGEI